MSKVTRRLDVTITVDLDPEEAAGGHFVAALRQLANTHEQAHINKCGVGKQGSIAGEDHGEPYIVVWNAETYPVLTAQQPTPAERMECGTDAPA